MTGSGDGGLQHETRAASARTALRRPIGLPKVLALIVVVVVALVLAATVASDRPGLAWITVLVAAAIGVTGLVADTYAGRPAVGWAFLLAALFRPLTLLLVDEALAGLGLISNIFFWGLLSTGVLLYQSGGDHLRSYEAAYLATLVVVIPFRIGAQIIFFATYSYGALLDVILSAVFLVLVADRIRYAAGFERMTMLPVLSAAIFASATNVTGAFAWMLRPPWELPALLAVQNVALLGVPLGIVVASLRRRLAHGHVADEIAGLPWPTDVADVRDALRRVLRDDRLEVLYCQEDDVYTDSDGTRVHPVRAYDQVHIPVTDGQGQRVALIVADARLSQHRDLLKTAAASSALPLMNARLYSGLREQAESLRLAQIRVEEARLEERRQLGRNLHDGVQLRLAALTLRMAELSFAVPDAELGRQLDRAKGEVQGVLADLRDVARGIHPVLTEEGLGAALESLAERQPVSVTVEATDQRYPPAVEVAAYYVVVECLANIMKHAQAHAVHVMLAARDSELTVEVVDDGVGGADPRQGTGLQGLEDRIRFLRGTLTIDSPSGAGTTVRAVIPCVSR